MPEMWYYTTEGKQMDPVSMRELKRLVGDGILKPTDMVWKDGMARWIRASSVKELFPDPSSALDQYFTHTKDQDGKANVIAAPLSVSPQAASAVEPKSTTKAVAPPTADEQGAAQTQNKRPRSSEEDEHPAPRGRPQPASSGSNVPIIIALVLGAIIILGALGVGVIILVAVTQSSGDGKINPTNLIKGEKKYELRLNNNAHDTRLFSFKKGVKYEIIIKTVPKEVDVDVYIFHPNGNVEAHDDLPNADCYVPWTPRADGEYRVEIRNLEHDGPAQCSVTIREFRNDNINLDKKDPKDQPLPPDTMEGKGLKAFTISPAKKEESQKFRVRAGHKASFKFAPTKSGPTTDFNIIVVKDSDPNQIIAQDVGEGPQASVSFVLNTTEIVRVRILNASGKGNAPFSKGFLDYDASPVP